MLMLSNRFAHIGKRIQILHMHAVKVVNCYFVAFAQVVGEVIIPASQTGIYKLILFYKPVCTRDFENFRAKRVEPYRIIRIGN